MTLLKKHLQSVSDADLPIWRLFSFRLSDRNAGKYPHPAIRSVSSLATRDGSEPSLFPQTRVARSNCLRCEQTRKHANFLRIVTFVGPSRGFFVAPNNLIFISQRSRVLDSMLRCCLTGSDGRTTR